MDVVCIFPLELGEGDISVLDGLAEELTGGLEVSEDVATLVSCGFTTALEAGSAEVDIVAVQALVTITSNRVTAARMTFDVVHFFVLIRLGSVIGKY